MPLLHIVGLTLTGLTFTAAACFMAKETKEFYTAALETFGEYLGNSCLPQVFVTDRKKALMNSIADVFPEAKNMLCRWHINKNILAKTKFPGGTEQQDAFLGQWNRLVLSKTEDDLAAAWERLEADFADAPVLVDYAFGWLDY